MRRSLTTYEWVWIIIAGLAVPLVVLMIWDSYPTMSGFGTAGADLQQALGGLGGLILLGLIVLVYFSPMCVAYYRGHPNAMAIFALNLLLGWTFIGWVVALVWALTAVPRRESAPGSQPSAT
jgi:Superinfection immunity protein